MGVKNKPLQGKAIFREFNKAIHYWVKELGLTKFNRIFERYILKKVEKHNLVENKGR